MSDVIKLKEELQKTGYKFTFIAEKTGISYDSLIQYLNGHRPMPESKFKCVVLAMGLDPKIFGLNDINNFHSGPEAA